MDGFDADTRLVDGHSQSHEAGHRHFRINARQVLAIATATAILCAGLNGLVQMLKVAVEVARCR